MSAATIDTALHPQRVALKLPLAQRLDDLAPAIEVFHRCLQRGWLEGALLDVADYRHVPGGPGVLLVGHDVDLGLTHDTLTVTRKRSAGDDVATQVGDLLRMAAVADEALAYDGTLDARVDWGAATVELLDRRLETELGRATDSDPSTGPAAVVAAAVAPRLATVFGDDVTVAGVPDAGDGGPLAVQLDAATPPTSAEVVARLGGSRAPMQSPFDVPVEELARRRGDDDVVVLDVREESERTTATLDGLLVPLAQLPDRLDELDPDATILVHCRAGWRGAKAVQLLRDAGFTDAWNVNGALVAWADRVDPTFPRY